MLHTVVTVVVNVKVSNGIDGAERSGETNCLQEVQIVFFHVATYVVL